MEPTLAEVRLFAGNFAPRGWALCNGQLLAIAQNSALFSLLGTTFGGDGRTTFALPDLRSRVPVGAGQGAGLSNHSQGSKGGTESNTLVSANLPTHTHNVWVDNIFNMPVGSNPDTDSPSDAFLSTTSGINAYNQNAPDSNMAAMQTNITAQVTNSGGNVPFTNIQPSLGLNYIICLQGMFPSRS